MVIAITETHLSPCTLDSEVHIEGFTIYRRDRINRSHGGVAIYIRNDVVVESTYDFSNGVCEYLGLKTIIASKVTLLSLIYRPPDAKTPEFLEIISFIREHVPIDEAPLKDHIILGDFNFPGLFTPSADIPISNPPSGPQQAALTLLTNDLLMSQVVCDPTRNGNILDLAFVNNLDLVLDTYVTPTVYSDHNIIFIGLDIGPLAQNHGSTIFKNDLSDVNIYSADFEKINEELGKINWIQLFVGRSIDENFQLLVDIITSLIVKYSQKKRNK